MMNAMSEQPEQPKQPKEPDIIVIGFEKKSFYLYKGDQYLSQILLTDGTYPKPVLCVHFDTIFDAKRVIGDTFSLADCWGIHPEIIDRMRETKTLVETDA
ncbi:MAG: hypothetical protein ABJL99_12250 [Aliishimia sp.]